MISFGKMPKDAGVRWCILRKSAEGCGRRRRWMVLRWMVLRWMALRWGGASESGLEGDDAFVDEDGAEDEDADGGDAVDNDQDLEIEAVTEMCYES